MKTLLPALVSSRSKRRQTPSRDSYLPIKPSHDWGLLWGGTFVADLKLWFWSRGEDDHQPPALPQARLHQLQTVCVVTKSFLHFSLYFIFCVTDHVTSHKVLLRKIHLMCCWISQVQPRFYVLIKNIRMLTFSWDVISALDEESISTFVFENWGQSRRDKMTDFVLGVSVQLVGLVHHIGIIQLCIWDTRKSIQIIL